MIIELVEIQVQSRKETELIDITERVQQAVADSGVRRGLVNIMTKHTTSGIVVNEGQICLEQDISNYLADLAPVHHSQRGYYHNRYLESDGRLGFNAGAHLQSVLSGYFAYFPVAEGQIVKGGRHRIYFAEYDGPLMREVVIQVLGE
jgi:secondary thiamine-phosphate synthase enzyme